MINNCMYDCITISYMHIYVCTQDWKRRVRPALHNYHRRLKFWDCNFDSAAIVIITATYSNSYNSIYTPRDPSSFRIMTLASGTVIMKSPKIWVRLRENSLLALVMLSSTTSMKRAKAGTSLKRGRPPTPLKSTLKCWSPESKFNHDHNT